MTTTTNLIRHKRIYDVSPARKLGMGIVEIVISLLIFFVFALNTQAEQLTRFVMTPGGINQGMMRDLVLPSRTTLCCAL